MGRFVADFSLEELKQYRPDLKNKPDDFDFFWMSEKSRMNKFHPNVAICWRSYPVPQVDVADIKIESFDGTSLQGLLMKPKDLNECPVLFSFHGYTGHQGHPTDFLKWTSLGVAVLSFDIRGQGKSPDLARYLNGNRVTGWMLNGILTPDLYYYTNVYRDILIQLNWLTSKNDILSPTVLGFVGFSQGGGLALIAGALSQGADFVISDYPFLTHVERAMKIAMSGPYLELVNYFKLHDPLYKTYDQVLNTLAYVDSLHFCQSITCPTLMSVGLEDATTPPSTVFAAYNYLSSTDKKLEVYPQYGHEINPFHEEQKIEFIAKQVFK